MGSIHNHPQLKFSGDELITILESSLKGSKVLIPGSEEYSNKVKRWSDASEKPAVCPLLCPQMGQHLIGPTRGLFSS